MGGKRLKNGPRELFAELEGNRRVVLSGCRGILLYTEDRVCLRTSTGTVTIYGQQLELGCMTPDGTAVTGQLQRIELAE